MSGKRYIQASILATLLDEGTATRPQLVARIGCGCGALHNAMQALMLAGLLCEAPADLRTSRLAAFGLTKAGIEKALAVDPAEVEHA